WRVLFMSTERSRRSRSVILLHPADLFARKGRSGRPLWARLLTWLVVDLAVLCAAGWSLRQSGAMAPERFSSAAEYAFLTPDDDGQADDANPGLPFFVAASQLVNATPLATEKAPTCASNQAIVTPAALPLSTAVGKKDGGKTVAVITRSPSPPVYTQVNAGSKPRIKRLWSISGEDVRLQLA